MEGLEFYKENYPEVLRLRQAVITLNIKFTLHPSFFVPSESFITVAMQVGNKQYIIPLMDEYHDFDANKPALALHLVLMACEEFEEAEDYLVWANEQGLTIADERCRAAWFHLRDEVPRICQFLGNDVQPISSFDYQLSAGATQFLRQIDTI